MDGRVWRENVSERGSDARKVVRLPVFALEQGVGFAVSAEVLVRAIEFDVASELIRNVAQMAEHGAEAADFDIGVGTLPRLHALEPVLLVRLGNGLHLRLDLAA